MNGYIAFYNGKRAEIYAETLADASQKARTQFKPPKSKAHMVSVSLAELNVPMNPDGTPAAPGSQVTHTPDM